MSSLFHTACSGGALVSSVLAPRFIEREFEAYLTRGTRVARDSHEAPRGTPGHCANIVDGSISRYQCVVPSTWNASPRGRSGEFGPYGAALVAT